MVRILFVCLGNICRSPLAEGILRRQASEVDADVFVDSAGIGDWHIGQLPDPRAVQVGRAHGCEMTMRARQVRSSDFSTFDWLVAMDRANVRDLLGWPNTQPDKIRLARGYASSEIGLEVPDPYYGDLQDFVDVAEMLEDACQGILNSIADPS